MWQDNEDVWGQESLPICIALYPFLSLVPALWPLPVLVGSCIGLVAVGSRMLSAQSRRTPSHHSSSREEGKISLFT